ncbi:O-antigen ligase family protein [Paradesulfitobacterium ferrireducens]|uniref:O-antigen ligase family protein n=1 Tax=Paradesulfitobacterium ferrireducens TaxID=2816476 RepID=UPI001A906229|nr:hypothetical protein [Paradesulfitobacterium ferrireducens]
MIGINLKRVSKAGSSSERILAFSLWLSVLASGLYYQKTWLLPAIVLGFYVLSRMGLALLSRRRQGQSYYSRKSGVQGRSLELSDFGLTDFVLLGLAGLSALGLIHPVRFIDGLFEVLRWLVYWLVYRFAAGAGRKGYTGDRLLTHLRWAAVTVAVIGWLPWANLIWPAPPLPEAGRFSSVFGYPNATAAFVGAALLLPGGSFLTKAFLGVSLLSTGSRGSLAALLLVLALIGIKVWQAKKNTGARKRTLGGTAANAWRQIKQWGWSQSTGFGRGFLIYILKRLILFVIILMLSVKVFPNAWEHLRSWDLFSPSIGQRLLYYLDGLSLAWKAQGWPRAGGWLAFPAVQTLPYWTVHPHSGLIQVLLNQGLAGLGLIAAWTVWMWRRLGEGAGKWPMLFLILHSMVDADFAFGALGLVFWLLAGVTISQSSGSGFYEAARQSVKFPWTLMQARVLRAGLYGLAALYLLLMPTLNLVQPELINPGQALSREAERVQAHDPGAGARLWRQGLSWDQTEISWRRQLAELELAQGNIEAGLRAVEETLAWRSFDLNAYEWAQGAVLHAADAMRESKSASGSGDARTLYHWVQMIPARIEEKQGLIPGYARRLWPEWENFKPTPAIDYLAEYARQRTLTPANF